jgi:hypothetical protein
MKVWFRGVRGRQGGSFAMKPRTDDQSEGEKAEPKLREKEGAKR